MAVDTTYPANFAQRRQDGSIHIPTGGVLEVESGGALTLDAGTKFTAPGNSGTFTCAASANTVVANTNVTASSLIFVMPTNAAAATLQGSSKCLYVSAVTAGTSFTVTATGGAAGTETFNYWIVG